MITFLIASIVFGSLSIGAIILSIVVNYLLKRSPNIELTQGKLKNGNDNVEEAVKYLKITNEADFK